MRRYKGSDVFDMMRTISAMVGKGSVSHNSRQFNAKNTDPERTPLNINYCNEDIREVYHRLFDDALERFNDKQTRSDRRIDDYYEKIRRGKQEKPFHELILQIGNCDDTGATTDVGAKAKAALDEYYRGFAERNPNLCVFSAHLHMDEATPHIHIDFVPFITGSKRGLDTRVSLKQALAAQGFKGGTRRETEWSQWVQSEKEQLAMVMERYGFEWEHKGTHEKHLSVLEYEKKVRAEEVAELDAQVTEKKSEIAALDQQAEQAQAEVKEIEAVLATVEKQQVKIAEIEKVQPKKSALTGKVSMTEAEYETLQTAAKKYVTYKRKDIGLQKQVEQLTEQLSQKDSFIDKLKGIIAGLKNKIAELEQKLSSRDSIREQMERGRLKSENDSLRKENQKLRDVLAAHGIPFGRKQVDRDSR